MAEGDRKRPKRWYASGLHFECQVDCGACCSNHDDYAYVYLEEGEPERLARFLECSPASFRRRHTTVDDGHVVLRMDRPACPFLDGTRCEVYPVRPVQCRTFPFWRENLRSRAEWKRLAKFCPGIGKGELIDLPTIDEELSAREISTGPPSHLY